MLIFKSSKYCLSRYQFQLFETETLSLLCLRWLIFKSLLILTTIDDNCIVLLLFDNTSLDHIIDKLSCLLILLCLLLSCNKLLLNHVQSSHLCSVFVLFLQLFLIFFFDFSFCSSSFRSNLEHIDSSSI